MEKMSAADTEDFYKIVKKYRKEFPDANRTILARLIRAELKIEYNSGRYRTLDRQLKNEFDEIERLNKIIGQLHDEKIKLKNQGELREKHLEDLNIKLEWLETYVNLNDYIETEEDFKQIRDLLEKLREEKHQRDQVKEHGQDQEDRALLG